MRCQVEVLATALINTEVTSVAELSQRLEMLFQGNHTQSLTYKQLIFTDLMPTSKILVFKILSIFINILLKH